MSREERERIQDMIDLCRAIHRFTEDLDFEAFEADQEKQFAVTHALFLLGEASKALSTETTAGAPEIDWSALARMRDRLAHHYWTVANRVVWDTASTNVPELLTSWKGQLISNNGLQEMRANYPCRSLEMTLFRLLPNTARKLQNSALPPLG